MLLANFIAALSNALRHRKIMFKYPNSSVFIFKFLNLLVSEGLIVGYSSFIVNTSKKRIRSKRLGLIIFFRYHRGRYNVLRSAALISKPSWSKFVSYYGLKNILFKHPSSIFFLSTNKGLVSSTVANQFKLGGKLFAQFN